MTLRRLSNQELVRLKYAVVSIVLALGVALAVLAQATVSRFDPGSALSPAGPARPSSQPPAALQNALERLERGAEGTNGLILRSVDAGWVVGYRGAALMPQGSLRRLWLGIAALDAVDRGEIQLEDRPRLAATSSAGPEPTVASLLQLGVAADDLGAQDEILAGLGGPRAIQAFLDSKSLHEIAFGPPAAQLMRMRSRSPARWSVTDGDAATPEGVAIAAAALAEGRLLERPSTERVLGYFQPSKGSPRGWKTVVLRGASFGPDKTSIGANQLIILQARSGERFVLAVSCVEGADPRNRCEMISKAAIAELARHVGRGWDG